MNIIDGRAIFGIIGTMFTSVITWFQTIIHIAEWIPIIPALATALYMCVKAYNEYHNGKMKRDQFNNEN